MLWLRGHFWDVAVTHAEGSWNINLQARNYLPWDSPIFEHCRNGDIAAVKQMFRDGTASPHDTINLPNEANTLLQVGCQSLRHRPLC